VLLLFLGATLLASLSPGPVVLLTIAVSLHSGVGSAMRAILGICAGSTSYLLVALAGLLAVLVAHRTVFHAVQIAGAIYLVYLGARMLWFGLRSASTAEMVSGVSARPFVDGLVTQLSNPKAILYWTALLPPFLDPVRPIPQQLFVLAGIGIAVDFVVLSAYALGAASVRRWLKTPRYQRWLNLVSGALFVFTGVALAMGSIGAWRGTP
jgi:threonine/homoserine/homoserine lactone efflux protein